jgi:hypothetical protein
LLKQLPLQLSLPSIATTASDACSQLSPPSFPPPPSIIIVVMTIKIIISMRHAADSNAPLLPPPSPRCCRISKRAAATAKIALLPSCRLRHQAGCRHRAPAATTAANAWQPPRYHCLQNKKRILLTNLFFTMMATAACSDDCGATRQQRWQCCYLQLPRIASMLQSDKREASSHIENKNKMTEHADTLKILIIQLLLE